MKLSKLITIAALASMGISAISVRADTQTYSYKIFSPEGFPTFAELKIEEEDGEIIIRILARNPSVCLQGKIPATKLVGEFSTTYTLKQRFHDCQGTRMVIQNDGLGGRVELKEGEDWVTRKVTQDYLVRKS